MGSMLKGVLIVTKKQEQKYYSLDNILKKNCVYNVIFGERSNGKTYSVLSRCILRNNYVGINNCEKRGRPLPIKSILTCKYFVCWEKMKD